MIRDRDWIAGHIPHRGRMCLLDRVEACDEARIRCSTRSHLDPANPLRAHGRLGIAAGIEYAAQAMAVHGAMMSPEAGAPQLGYIASLRGVELFGERLDEGPAPLDVTAERISGDARTILYGFEVARAGRCLLRGRATVVLRAGGVPA